MQRLNALLRHLPVWLVWVVACLPAIWLFWGALSGGLGVDPVKAIEHSLGLSALQLLMASLCITPLRWIGLNLLRYRRALGVMAFAYASLHLLTWVVLDMGLRWGEMGDDLVKRPYIIIGMAGYLALIPLALTSTDGAIRRLGRLWGRLHRLSYLAVVAGALHFLILVKSWPPEPIIYAILVALLLLSRVVKSGKMNINPRERKKI